MDSKVSETLARLDERTKAIQDQLLSIKQDVRVQNETVIKKVDELENKLEKKMREIDDRYVSKEQFNPVQRLVYGVVGLILITVSGALISIVIKKPLP